MSRPLRYSFASSARGFTLTEMIISVALVMLLVFGINQVFEITSKTVGTGQALAAANRDVRASRNVLEADFASIITDEAPFLALRSSRVTTFRNRQDMENDLDYDPANHSTGKILTVDLNDNGVEGETNLNGNASDGNVYPDSEVIPPALYNHRSHRTDVFSFFARGDFKRQTGNGAMFTSEMTAKNAWIWYGHLDLYNKEGDPASMGSYISPGEGTPQSNRSNYFGNQFVLGRFAMLLTGRDNDNNVVDRTFHPDTTPPPAIAVEWGFQQYIGQNSEDPSLGTTEWSPIDYLGSAGPIPVPLSPLASWPVLSSHAYVPDDGTPDNYDATLAYVTYLNGDDIPQDGRAGQSYVPIQSSRFDLAVVLNLGSVTPAAPDPVDTYRQRLAQAIEDQLLTPPDPFNDLIDTPDMWQDDYWWWDGLIYRFVSNPQIARPLDSTALARALPYFLGGSPQFIVEYAGDYLRQDQTGDVAGIYGYSYTYVDASGVFQTATELFDDGTDGQIDFVIPGYLGNWNAIESYVPDNIVFNTADGEYYKAINANTGDTPPSSNWAATTLPAREIRWYGMPRDTSSMKSPGVTDNSIRGCVGVLGAYAPGPVGASDVHPNEMVDVVPVRDLILYWLDRNDLWPEDIIVPPDVYVSNSAGAPFERGLGLITNDLEARDEYLSPSAGMAEDEVYTCVWGPARRVDPAVAGDPNEDIDPKPRLIRLTIVLDDPVGRLPEGQSMQFVFALP